MAKYRIVRKQYGVSENWLYPQKCIFSLFGIINIWMDIDSEGVIAIFSNSICRFYGGDEKTAIAFIKSLRAFG